MTADVAQVEKKKAHCVATYETATCLTRVHVRACASACVCACTLVCASVCVNKEKAPY